MGNNVPFAVVDVVAESGNHKNYGFTFEYEKKK